MMDTQARIGDVKVFHVTTMSGECYGVAADNNYDARCLVHGRLESDGCDEPIQRVEMVGKGDWERGTVLHY